MNNKEWPWEDKHGDWVLVPVPKEERRSFLTIFYTFTGVLACLTVLWGGGLIGTQFNLMGGVLVAIVGSAIVAFIGVLVGPIGGVSRCSTYVNLRPSFGNLGSQVWGTLAFAIPGIGWFAVQTWLFGVIVHTIFPTAPWATVFVASIWGGILMTTTTYIGFKGLAFLSYLAVPFFVVIAGFGVMVGVVQGGGFAGIASIQPTSPVSFGVGVTEVAGLYVVGAIAMADICRFGTKIWHGSIAWVIQIMVFQVYMVVGAAMLTLVTGEANVAVALVAAGAGAGALLMAILGQWSSNDNNLYSPSLAINLWAPIKRRKIVLIVGGIGVVLAALIASVWGAAMEPLQAFLIFLGTAIPSIGGVLIADFWLYRWYKGEPFKERYQFKPSMKFSNVNWVGWFSAIVATGLAGWVIKGAIPATFNALWLGAVLYIVIAIACDKTGVKMYLGEHIIDRTGV